MKRNLSWKPADSIGELGCGFQNTFFFVIVLICYSILVSEAEKRDFFFSFLPGEEEEKQCE